ncbi:MAG: hypothetical protein ABIR79_04275, partial [Candidatus Binatia bacterium]
MAFVSFPSSADAATARVRWLPSPDPTVTRYDVYVRDAGAAHLNDAAWSGDPTPADDGAMSALVSFTPSASGANYFAVVAVRAADESTLSAELPTGMPIACHADHCETKTSCDFGELLDGTSCDGATDDPCLAACRAGECGTSSGSDGASAEVELDRLRFRSRDAGVALSIKGRFASADPVDPASTGAVVEIRTPDGVTLHTASVGGPAFKSAASGRRFHFAAAGADADPGWHGLQRLDFRQRAGRWIVT